MIGFPAAVSDCERRRRGHSIPLEARKDSHMVEPQRSGPPSPAVASEPVRYAPRLIASIIPCTRVALRQTVRLAVFTTLVAVLAVIAAVIVFRVVDPPGSMLIWSQRQEGRPIDQRWTALERISPALVRAVIMSEDNQFCRHWGVDVRELTTTLRKAERQGLDPSRGASTLSMQLTKNLLLWPDKSYLRKAVELPLTLLVELVWPKRRIMEVYLNIAEWGPGVFGAEAASQHHFRKPASRLTEMEATLLAVALPNPFTRVASRPSPALQRVAALIEHRVKVMGTRADCVLGRTPKIGPSAGLRLGDRLRSAIN
jgi:monofunctional glycosyltransferase